MKTLKNVTTIAVVGLIAAASTIPAFADNANPAAPSTAYDAPVSLSLNFAYHVDMDMPEQDVFIEREKGSGQVWRVTKADQDMAAPLFRTARPQEHSPFDPEANGPFDKGEDLGLTLGEWYAGKGKGTYSCEDGNGSINVVFTNMVPKAVYTMWHAFMAMPPTTPFIGTYDLPMGARDGSDSVFSTDSNGNAIFQRNFTPCLQMTGEHLAGLLAVNYHSNSKTYGVLPGEFATDAHIQLINILPKRSGL